MTPRLPSEPPLTRRFEWRDAPLLPALALLTLLTAVVAAFSLRWELCWDALDMNYLGLLINKMGRAPYRDIFDPNMPGAMLFHSLLTRIFGYSDFGSRVFDVLYLTALAASTALLLRRFDWRVRWAGAVLYPWIYLARGEYVTLQRDHLLILPIVWATTAATSERWNKRPRARFAAMGFFVGLAALLKPQAALWLAVLAIYDIGRRAEARAGWRDGARFAAPRVAAAGAGFAAPFAACLLWLWAVGGLNAFFAMARDWWPYHTKMFFYHGRFVYASGLNAWRARFGELPFRFPFVWLAVAGAALFGWINARRDAASDDGRRAVVRLAAIGAATFLISVVLVGQPHPYVWLPLGYFLTLLASMGAQRPAARPRPRLDDWAPLGTLLALLALLICPLFWPISFRQQCVGKPPQFCMENKPRDISAYLKAHAAPGDKAQFLDWFGGGTEAAWRAQIDTATRYYVDYQFYLRPSAPYVEALQTDFLDRLAASPPRFFIRITEGRNQFRYDAADLAAAGAFNDRLRNVVEANYDVALRGEGFVILERKPRAD